MPNPDTSVRPPIPPAVRSLLERLWENGHAAYVVGGSLRDALLGREPADWDLATDARPDRILALFPGSVYENRFGTVAVREGDDVHEITTFRTDHEYADFRRPHRVEFGDRIELDLARRDFTVNAMAWGAEPAGAAHAGGRADTGGRSEMAHPSAGAGRPEMPSAVGLVDPFDGRADVAARLLRAVGDPRQRFEEDALRMVRAVRLAATLGFGVEPATLAAIQARATLVGYLSGERIAAELEKLLDADAPSVGLDLAAGTGVLAVISPELGAQRGIPQNKVEGEDLWDHTLRTVDAAPRERPVVRLAALLHDIGKPATMSDGHFRGHEAVGAELARAFLERIRMPRAVSERVVHLVRHHMFTYDPSWGDAGIRRFIKRVGRAALDELFELREADNIGSGLDRNDRALDDLRRRVHEQLLAEVVLDREHLAIRGDDLIADLGLSPGPTLGRILDELLERVIADPALNDRPTLLLMAESMLADEA
jgi:putative nucleotidyltransferase with HDIG domain